MCPEAIYRRYFYPVFPWQYYAKPILQFVENVFKSMSHMYVLGAGGMRALDVPGSCCGLPLCGQSLLHRQKQLRGQDQRDNLYVSKYLLLGDTSLGGLMLVTASWEHLIGTR